MRPAGSNKTAINQLQIKFMKKISLLLTTISIAVASYAQIGIGTTSPNSTLDVRGSLSVGYRAFTSSTTASSTDNTLIFTGTTAATLTLPNATTCSGRIYAIKNASTTSPLPVLTIATTSSQTIDAGASWLLNDSKEMITVVSDGSNWSITGSGPVKTRDNHILVQSVNDFPAPVSGIINLVAGTTYEINGTIVLSSKINLNGCYLIGSDANNDKLIYTPSSGELFTGTKGGTVKTLTLAAITTGSKLFNLVMGAAENLIIRDAIIANCKDVGLVKGGYITFFSVINYSGNTNGITYENISNLLIDNTAWFPNNSNTFEKITGTFDVIEKLGGFSNSTTALTATALDVTGITTITEGASLKNTAFLGNGTRITGTFSKKWEVESQGVPTEKDGVATGTLYISSAAATIISTINTPKKIAGTTTATELQRFTMPANNRLQYDGTKTRVFIINAVMSVYGTSGTYGYSFYIYKNGAQVSASRQKTKVYSSSGDIQVVALVCSVTLAPGDYIEVWAENNDSNIDVTASNMTLSAK
jgi:hypothetical protein